MFALKCILSFVIISVYSWFNLAFETAGRLEAGKIAGDQFISSDQAYVFSTFEMSFWQSLGISSLILFILLGIVWAASIKRAILHLSEV